MTIIYNGKALDSCVKTSDIDFDDNNHINITTNVSSSYAVISDIL